MANIGEALSSLGITEWVLRGEPKDEDELKSMFRKITVADEKCSSIETDAT